MSDEPLYSSAIYIVPNAETSMGDSVSDLAADGAAARDKSDRANYASHDAEEAKAGAAAAKREAAKLRKRNQRARTAKAQEDTAKLIESGMCDDVGLAEMHITRLKYELPVVKNESKDDLWARICDFECRRDGVLLPWHKAGQPGVNAVTKAENKATDIVWCNLLNIPLFPAEGGEERRDRIIRAWCKNGHRAWLTKKQRWADEGKLDCNCQDDYEERQQLGRAGSDRVVYDKVDDIYNWSEQVSEVTK